MSTSSPKIDELIEALPTGSGESVDPGTFLTRWLGDKSRRRVPVGRFSRLRVLGSLEARIGVAYLVWWLRHSAKPKDERAATLEKTHLKAALELFDGMTYLRGAVMKLGQVLATHPNAAPQGFADVLGHLHFEAPPMHFSLLRELFIAELGAEPEELFDDFETGAFAAASLGQVHRARLKGSGRRVAVKIQYPAIGRSIRDDFRNLAALLAPMRLGADWDNLEVLVEDMRRVLDIETDYEEEAKHLKEARELFDEDEGIVVPRVHDGFSTRRVLTMDYLEGVHLNEFMAGEPSQDVRDDFGTRIGTALFRMWYTSRLVYADAQPGNYIFMPDGRLGAIDFGCCCRMDDEDFACMAGIERGYRSEPDGLHDALARSGDLKAHQRAEVERLDLMTEWGGWAWEPLLHDGPFDFGDEDYFRRGVELYGKLLKKRYTRSRPINIWMTRSIYGGRAMLARMKARVDLGAVHRRETTVSV